MSTPETASPKPARRKGWFPLLVAGLLLLLALLLLRSCNDGRWPPWGDGSGRSGADSLARRDSLARLDSLALLDSLRRADSLAQADSLALSRRNDSLFGARNLSREDSLRLRDSLARADSLARRRADSLAALRARRAFVADSLSRLRGANAGLSRLDSLRRATGDSVGPIVFADPAPGIHPAPVDVAVIVMEPGSMPLCGPRSDSLKPCRNLIRVTKATRLWIAAEDSLGNRTPAREMRWEIDPDASRCGVRRALVPLSESREICVDAYEYPNDPSQPPRTSVNWEEASALCAKVGRRLCTADELAAACKGPEEWTYPYGKTYAASYCQVTETKIGRGVGKPACRSWWGAYNLVGNVWEWTSTPNGSTFLTSGGTYEGGPENRCGKTSRSFFRQNRYEAVGFRCCEDLSGVAVP
jgi:hypothetical protein